MMQQLDLFPDATHLYWIDPARSMKRFYRLFLQPDLFGGYSLVREWGRVGSGGRVRRDAHQSEGQAISVLIAISQAKARRGYAPID